MELLSRTKSFFRAVFHREKMEGEMDEELRFHLEARADDLVLHHGLSRKEGLRRARIEFGSVDKYTESVRESYGLRFPDTLWRNTQYACRQFRRSPGFTLAAILTLALGIGANTALFSVYYRTLLSPLPVEEPERLVNLAAPGPKPGQPFPDITGGVDDLFSYPMFRDLERDQTVFTGIAAQRIFNANLVTHDENWSGNGAGYLVSGSYFQVLSVKAAMGRLLDPGDDAILDEPHVVVLSYGFWQTRFGGDPGVLNQTIDINGQSMTIIGVTERTFKGTIFLVEPDVFVPITMRRFMIPKFTDFQNRHNYWLFLFARLKPGVSPEQARTSVNHPYHTIINEVEAPLLVGISEQTEEQFRAKTITLQRGAHGRNPNVVPTKNHLLPLMGLTMLACIMACTNVAGLLLARGAARKGEFAVRRSIGASRIQVVMQLLTESFLLALLAGAVSIVVAQWTIKLLASSLPAEVATLFQFSLNTTVLLFAAALTLGTGLLFGLLPAMHNTKTDLSNSLRIQPAGRTGARSATRFRKLLCTTQITLALALLVVAGFFTKSLVNISTIDIGMKIDNIATFRIAPTRNGYPPERALQLFEQLKEGVNAMPGVSGVTSSMMPLFDNTRGQSYMSAEGFDAGPDTDVSSFVNTIDSDYFSTLGIPMISGREFNRSDNSNSQPVAIVNEAFAEKFKLGRNAVGKYIGGQNGALNIRIVGLVKNSKFLNVTEQATPFFYRPYRQVFPYWDPVYYIKTSVKAESVMSKIRKLAARLDPKLPVEGLGTLAYQVEKNIGALRAISILTTSFACLAILLTAIGLYGVLAYMVTARTYEIGLRIALGASRAKARAIVFRQVVIMTIVGCALGLVLAAGLGRVMQIFVELYGIDVWDPAVFSISTLSIVLIALAAGFIPAYRASRIDPMQALRCE